MVRADTEKMLGANLPANFVETFWSKALPPKSKASKTKVIVAMANAWIELSDSVKEYYLNPSPKHESLKDFVESIVENKMKELMAGIQTSQNAAEFKDT